MMDKNALIITQAIAEGVAAVCNRLQQLEIEDLEDDDETEDQEDSEGDSSAEETTTD
jgi:hypothetical protein